MISEFKYPFNTACDSSNHAVISEYSNSLQYCDSSNHAAISEYSNSLSIMWYPDLINFDKVCTNIRILTIWQHSDITTCASLSMRSVIQAQNLSLRDSTVRSWKLRVYYFVGNLTTMFSKQNYNDRWMLEENTEDQTTHESSSSWFTILNHVENDVASHKLHQVMTDKQTDLRNKTRAILVHPAVWSMNKQRIAVFLWFWNLHFFICLTQDINNSTVNFRFCKC